MARPDLTTEIATPTVSGPRAAAAWRPLTSLTPGRVAALLRRAAQGDARDYLLAAEEIAEKDLHYRAVLATRRMAVAALPLEVEAADDSAAAHAAAELTRSALARLPVGELLMHLMDAVAKGYAVAEIVWDTRQSPWLPERVLPRPAHWFRFSRQGPAELRLLSETAPHSGEALPPARFIVHRLAHADSPLTAGVARAVLWAWVIKSYALRDWARFCELYGQPLRLGKYDAAATPADVEVLKEAVLGLGADAAAVIPASMGVELIEAGGKAASADLYQRLLEYLDRAVSKAVLGQTLTTDQGASGSLAQARVHDDVRRELLRADAQALIATLERDLVTPLVHLNLGEAAPLPRLALRVVEPEDLGALAEQLERLVGLGLPVPLAWARAKWGIPEPDGTEPLLTPAADPLALAARQPPVAVPVRTLQATQPQPAPAPPDAMDALVDEAMADWRQQLGPLVTPLEILFGRAEREDWTAAELIEALAESLAEPHAATLADALARAAYAARLAGVHGREDVVEAPADGG
jgi:phage gp29-like protein